MGLVPAVINARSRLRTEFDDVDVDGIPLALGLENGNGAGDAIATPACEDGARVAKNSEVSPGEGGSALRDPKRAPIVMGAEVGNTQTGTVGNTHVISDDAS